MQAFLMVFLEQLAIVVNEQAHQNLENPHLPHLQIDVSYHQKPTH
jgi:hypothetical protein